MCLLVQNVLAYFLHRNRYIPILTRRVFVCMSEEVIRPSGRQHSASPARSDSSCSSARNSVRSRSRERRVTSPEQSTRSRSGSTSRGRRKSRSRRSTSRTRSRSYRKRSRSRRRDRSSERNRRDRSYRRRNVAARSHYHRRHTETTLSTAATAARDRSEACCVRIGVWFPDVVPVTQEQVIDEMDSIKMTRFVECVEMEVPDAVFGVSSVGSSSSSSNLPDVYWTRVYLTGPELADLCALELSMPNRLSKWKHYVVQRLPRIAPESGTNYCEANQDVIPREFERFHVEPTDCFAVMTSEGWTVFSTDELYRTQGVVEYTFAKQNISHPAHLQPLMLCPDFDAERFSVCREGFECTKVHVKSFAMTKCLVPCVTMNHRTTGKATTRSAKPPSTVDPSQWQQQRKHDTLVVRYLRDNETQNELLYMFAGCDGLVNAYVHCSREGSGSRRFGFVRFRDHRSACNAMLQTFDSGLNVSFYGTFEAVYGWPTSQFTGSNNIALMGTSSVKTAATDTASHVDEPKRDAQPMTTASSGCEHQAGTRGGDDDDEEERVPFPPLPEGWAHGISRRTNQYMFFQPKTKNSTTFKHPVTGASYSTR